VDFTNLVFGLSAQWHLVMMVNGQQIRMIKYKKQKNGLLLIPAINSPMHQQTVILSAPTRRSCVIAHKHTIPKFQIE
jgi:alcohol dehydrogenase YqhD (iron-dependent ADH family)